MAAFAPPIVSNSLKRMRARFQRTRQIAGLAALLSLSSTPVWSQSSGWQEDEWVARYTLSYPHFEHVRDALLDAIANEGLTAPTESLFSAMLERTAADLGHPPGLFVDAQLFTFCSARLAALLVQESRHHIASCPLTLSIYRLPDTPEQVHFSFRRAPPTAAGQAIEALLRRIVDNARATLE